jgi:hypothetical protein
MAGVTEERLHKTGRTYGSVRRTDRGKAPMVRARGLPDHLPAAAVVESL